MKLVVVAADPMELADVLSRCGNVATARLDVRWARSGCLNGHQVLMVANGSGRARARLATEAACAAWSPDAVVNTGFCGALDPALEVAAVVAATRIDGNQGGYDACPPAASRPHRSGVVYTLDRVAQSAAEKAALRSGGADVVEMEAAGVAAVARPLGLPFYCIRAVTDLAAESFANDFNAALLDDGHFDTMRILRGALCRPASRIPELVRLRLRCARAAHSLGEFLADCRF